MEGANLREGKKKVCSKWREDAVAAFRGRLLGRCMGGKKKKFRQGRRGKVTYLQVRKKKRQE